MEENTYFQKALANFTAEFAYVGAVKHLHDLGLAPEEIQKQLSYPVSLEQISRVIQEYEKEKALEHTTDMYVKTHSLEVMDARNILVKDGEAVAMVIVDYKDVTPFGRILKYNREGEHKVLKVSFQYWQDLGWTVEELDY